MRTTTIRCPGCGRMNRIPAAAKGRLRCPQCSRDLPWIVDATDEDFAEIAEQARLPVLVDMWATWCGPCRAVSPALEQLAVERAGQVKLVKVDVDRAPGLSQRFSIQAVPTLMIVVDGAVVARQAGAAPAAALRSWFDDTMAKVRRG